MACDADERLIIGDHLEIFFFLELILHAGVNRIYDHHRITIEHLGRIRRKDSIIVLLHALGETGDSLRIRFDEAPFAVFA